MLRSVKLFCLAVLLFSSWPAHAFEVIFLDPNAMILTGVQIDNNPAMVGPYPVEEWLDAYYSGGTGQWTTSGSVGGTTATIWLYSTGSYCRVTTSVATTDVLTTHDGDSNDGIMDVSVDGVKYATIDNYSSSGASWVVVVTGLPMTTHTLEVKSAGYHPGTGYDDIHIRGAAAVAPPIPTPGSITPTEGPVLGGTTVTIKGAGFLEGALVDFGVFPAADVVVEDFETITAVTGAADAPGIVDVLVTNPNQALGKLVASYTYLDVDQDEDGHTLFGDDCNDLDAEVNPDATEVCGDEIDNDCDGLELSCLDVDNDFDGFTENEGDCDDTNPEINPDSTEICGDGIDNDCWEGELSCDDVDNDGDGYTENGGDCDDTEPAVNPAAEEVPYDEIDNDCEDGDEVDVDGDGYVAAQAGGDDCNDTEAGVNPGAAEICADGIDQDCDGETDEGFDQDGDGYLDASSCEVGDDCDDSSDGIHPEMEESCDGIDQDCDDEVDEGYSDQDNDGIADCVDPDKDGDGYEGDADCVDTDPSIHPEAGEICDGIDQDCDGAIDEGFDADGDGHFIIEGCEAVGGDDCDDAAATTYPGAEELCDGIDQDCDGETDEGFDADGDGHLITEGCEAVGGDDCDDTAATTYPGAEEPCDGKDNDCNNVIDDGYPDADTDGLADCVDVDVDGDGYEAATDCNDLDAAIHPEAIEVCDGTDQDCDTLVDEDFDQDADGHFVIEGCEAVSGDDCEDTAATTYPGALEVCDGIDQDCDGETDEDFDLDDDGHLDAEKCDDLGDDCDDTDAAISPSATEVCNGWDDNCDGQLDEGYDVDEDGFTACGGQDPADCDDGDETIHPGAEEVCGNSIDEDCDGADESCITPTPGPGDDVSPTPGPGDDDTPVETPTTEPGDDDSPPDTSTPPAGDDVSPTPDEETSGGCSCNNTEAPEPSPLGLGVALCLVLFPCLLRRRREE